MIIANDNTVKMGLGGKDLKDSTCPRNGSQVRVLYLFGGLFSCFFQNNQSLSLDLRSRTHLLQNAELSAEGVPQIAGVFGDCIAGGGYMPIISDRFL